MYVIMYVDMLVKIVLNNIYVMFRNIKLIMLVIIFVS